MKIQKMNLQNENLGLNFVCLFSFTSAKPYTSIDAYEMNIARRKIYKMNFF
jgi:hypothetical protein